MSDRSKPSANRGLRRTLTFSLLTGVVFAIAAVAVSEGLDRDRYEQAVIGLTQESEWPFHDVHLATAAGQLDDGTLVEAAQRDLGLPLDPGDVTLDGERQDSNGILRITARADTPDDAAELANTVADAVVAEVTPDTPVRVVDRADGTSPAGSPWLIGGLGAVMGFIVGSVVWSTTSRDDDRATA